VESIKENKLLTKIKFDGFITLATGKSKKEIHWKNKNMLYSELVEKLSNTMRTPESYEEYKKMAKTEKDNIKDVGGFVGGSLKNGRRKAENVANRTLLTLDLDYVAGDIWSTIELLWGFGCLIYSTHTHAPDNQRLRLIIPLSRPVLPDEYQAISRMIADDLGIDQFDDTTYEPFRLMYWPSTSSNGEYIFKVQDLAWLNPDEILERYTFGWQDVSYWPESSRSKAKINSAIKRQEDPLEKKGIIGAFCRTYNISEAIAEFLDDVYTAGADDTRYTFVDGSTTGGVVVYEDKFSYSHHSTDPTSGILCNAFDLVRIHKFGELDDEAKEDTPSNRIPSYIKMCEFASSDNKVKMQLGKDIIENASEDFEVVEGEDNWLSKLSYTEFGKLKNTIKNFRIIIENHPLLKGKIALNEFSNRNIALEALPWDDDNRVRDWTGADDSGLREFLGAIYIDPKNNYDHAITLAFKNKAFHPVKDYFESLIWDGVNRVDTILIDYFGCEDTIYNRFIMKKWLVAGVTRIYKPGIKFDYMIVLSGKPDIGKSTFLEKLAGSEWFTDSLKAVDDKIVIEIMQGKFIAEFGELAGMRKTESEEIKHFLTKTEFNARLAYGKRSTHAPIQWIYAGTTNSTEFLKDKTGNRRFWPIDVFTGKKDIWKDLDNERDQIWAETYHLYKSGEKIYPNKEEKLLAEYQQNLHLEVDELEQILEDRLDWSAPEEQWQEYKFSDIVSSLSLSDRLKGQAKQNLKIILLNKGIKRRLKNSGSFYNLPPMIMIKNIVDFQSKS
jgi:predicted P-loop ATPase